MLIELYSEVSKQEQSYETQVKLYQNVEVDDYGYEDSNGLDDYGLEYDVIDYGNEDASYGILT